MPHGGVLPPSPMYAAFFAFQGMAFPERPMYAALSAFKPLLDVTDPAKKLLTREQAFLYHFPSLWNANR